MRLVSLHLRQWRSYESCDLEFPDGLIGVRGPNGAGKTTIAEAIGWALFGKLRPGAKVGDVRRQGADGARSSVELVFRLHNELCRVERVVGGSAKLWIGDGDEPETTQTRATNVRIAQLLEMTWETFERSVFARQKDVAALDPSATAESRKRHVERLLGLDRYRRAAEEAKAEARQLAARLEGRRDGLPDREALRVELTEAQERAASGDPVVGEAERAMQGARAEVQRLDDELERERARVEEHRRLQSELQHKAEQLTGLESDLEAARAQVRRRAAAADALSRINGAADGLADKQAAREAWERLRDCDRDLQAVVAAAPDAGDGRAAARSERLEVVRARLEELQATGRPDLRALEERRAALEAVAREPSVGDAEANLEAIVGEQKTAGERAAVLRQCIEDQEAHLALLTSGDHRAGCPTCLRPYDGDLESIAARHREQLAAMRVELADLETAVEPLRVGRLAAQTAVDRAREAQSALARTTGAPTLEAADVALREAQGAITRLDEELGALRSEKTELEAAKETDRAVLAALAAHEARLADHRARVTAAAGRLAVEAFDAAACDRAVEQHEAARLAAEERGRHLAVLEATEHAEQGLQQKERTRATVQAAVEATRDALTQLAFVPTHHDDVRDRFRAAQQAADAANEAFHDARLQAQAGSQDVAELRRRLDEAEAAHDEVRQLEHELREHTAAVELLTAFRTEQNARAWPQLEKGAGALMGEITGGRYADVRLSEDYKLTIVDRGEQHGLERFSGGEQDLANLCLRLAIAQWVARERRVDLGFVILDEVFGSQDEERRRRLVDELRALGGQFHQVVVITHLVDIAELCEHQLQVALPAAGRSEAAFAA